MNQKIKTSCLLLFCLILLPSLQLQAQSSSPERDTDVIIVEIGDQDISLADLINYYERNNLEDDYSDEDLKEFLPFYVDYKLKLTYGKDQGLFTDTAIMEEFENYSKQAAVSYWLENEIKKEMTDEFMERSKYELKSHHVLIQLDPNSSQGQVDEARQMIEKAREKFVGGEMTMEELNQEYSSRVQGQPAGGELPWFSAGVTVKPFEDALFSLETDEISEPVRTQFGFHIIYLEDKRERTSDRNVSHIFFRGSRGEQSADELSQNAFNALEEGRPWDEVAQEFSQDGSSANSGGDIGWIGYGTQYSQDFIEKVLNLDPVAAYSEPIQTNYGFHIFRIDSVRSYTNDEHRRAELMEQLEELPRFDANRQQVLEKIADEGNYTETEETKETIGTFFSDADSVSIENINVPQSLQDQSLISFNGETYTAGDFITWLEETHSDRSSSDYSESWLNSYREYMLDSQIISITQDRFPEFESETEGFLNGLVVFQVSDENIWNVETADSSALEQYYEENKGQYQFGERHDYTLLASRDDSVLTAALQMARDGEPIDSISGSFDNLLISRDSVAAPADEILESLNSTEFGEASEVFTYRNRDAHVIYHQLLEPREMTFDEAFHRVGSDYQPIREENFMNELRSQYRVRTFPERIR